MKFMVAYDASEKSQSVLKGAQRRMKKYETELLVVTSLKAEEGTEHLYSEEIKKAKSNLSDIALEMQQEGIECRTLLSMRGLEAGEDLVLLTKENAVDEVYIGIRKRSRLDKLIMGSVAQYIILKADCPVIAIK